MPQARHKKNKRTFPQSLFAVLALGIACLPLPLRSDAPRLVLPIDCTLGQDCYIQNFVDHDPGPGHIDYTCAQLTYDGHKGTDFALISRTAMAAGVMVQAASAGRVIALRDGMPDGLFLETSSGIEGRECGNGVVIDHGEGWQTQYCHLRQGSISVTDGQTVQAGTPLGQVGLSGKTEFPHLHLSLRKDGRVVDPFNPEDIQSCVGAPAPPLWHDPAPIYRPGGMISAGFADAVPDYDQVKSGNAATAHLPVDAPALVVWGLAFGGQTGDRITLEIDAPDGSEIISQIVQLEKPTALFYRAAGKRRSGLAWPEGNYRGQVSLIRGDQEISTQSTTITIGQ